VERTMTGTVRDGRSVRFDIEKLLVMWCRTMHSDISWPVYGQYHCKRCGRVYAVPWIAQEMGSAPAPALRIGPALEHARIA